jgi:mono/diheme cytochrome c family protein
MIAARGRVVARIGVMVGLVALACVNGGAAHVHERDTKWVAPPAAVQRTSPLAHRPDAAPGGRKLFHQQCASCHSPDGQGSERGPDLTARRVQAQTDGALFWKITQGNTRRGMPTFSFLPEPERWQLVLHLRAIATPSR